jgi:pyruvate,water dikinase
LDIVTMEPGHQEPTLQVASAAPVNRAHTRDDVARPTLSATQVREIARLALRIEQWYGSPQDIEWALDEQGRAWILQARPVTTFDALAARAKALEFYDPPRPPGSRWSRVNIAEALPGVPTPLTWSVWRAGLGTGQRESQMRLGVVAKRDHAPLPLLSRAGLAGAISRFALEPSRPDPRRAAQRVQ